MRRGRHEKRFITDDEDEDNSFTPAKDVGFIYDEKMLAHCCPWDSNVPESPQRLISAYERCQHYKLPQRCRNIQAIPATEQQILSVHDRDYFNRMKKTALMNHEELMSLSSTYDSVYFNNKTFECAMLAAGSTVALIDEVATGKVKCGMALIRPPGHHAMRDRAMGYCYFNNVAIAVRHALNSLRLERVLVVDWDVHHGQATQYEFYDDPRVLVFSVHRFENGSFWPQLAASDYDHIGCGAGTGYNINVPLNQTGVGNADYIAMLQQLVLPVAVQFSPELVIVSCGFDAALGDPEGENAVTPAGYAHLVHMLKPLAGGRICLVLEGGYCEKSQAESAALSLMALLDDPCPSLGPIVSTSESVCDSILHAIRVLRVYWKSLCFQDDATEADLSDLPIMFHPEQIRDREPVCAEADHAPYDIWNDYPTHTAAVQAEFDSRIQQLIDTTTLHRAPHRTCLVYDERMCLHKCTSNPGHPERPDRIRSAYKKLEETGLAERCHMIQPRIASEDETGLVHRASHISNLREMQYKTLSELHDLESDYASLYLSQEAYECAALAVGSTLAAVDSVMQAESETGIAVIRPPGHHAESHIGRGFCFFNNIAIAARYAQKHYSVQRVLIVDWDVHHGNGTQHCFEDDPSVLFISLHRYDGGTFFPGGQDADLRAVGMGRGKGYNINIPWDSPGSQLGDAEYVAAFQQVVMPVAYEFSPDLVLVSAGFDAGRGDPLGGCQVTPQGFAHLTQMLLALANRKLILVLEGGYNLVTVSESVAHCTAVLLADPAPPLPPLIPSTRAVITIQAVIDKHSKYWRSLQYQVKMPTREVTELWLHSRHAALKGDGPEKDHSLEEDSDRDDSLGRFSDAREETILQDLTRDMRKITVSDVEAVLRPRSHTPAEPSLSGMAEGVSLDYSHTGCISDQIDVKVKIDGSEGETVRKACADKVAPILNTETKETKETAELQPGIDNGTAVDTIESSGNRTTEDTTEGACCSNGTAGEMPEGACCSDATADVTMEGAYGGHGNRIRINSEFLGMATDSETVEVYAVVPLPWCPHVATVAPLPADGFDVHRACGVCEQVGENWLCLSCYQVYCGRYVNEHMLLHGVERGHVIVLSLADLSVWCYACQHYIHHPSLLEVKRAAHLSKFGEDMPHAGH